MSQQVLIDRRKAIVKLAGRLLASHKISIRFHDSVINDGMRRNNPDALDQRINRLEEMLIRETPSNHITSKNFHNEISKEVAYRAALNHSVGNIQYAVGGQSFLKGFRARGVYAQVKGKIEEILREKPALKIKISGKAQFSKDHKSADGTMGKKTIILTIDDDYVIITRTTDIDAVLKQAFEEQDGKIDDIEKNPETGYTLDHIINGSIGWFIYSPFRGGRWLDLPSVIKEKQCCINPQCRNVKDENLNMCFIWAILCGMAVHDGIKGKELQRVSGLKKLYLNKVNLDGLEFPTPVCQVKTFEKNNTNIAVNVIGLSKDNKPYPLHVASNKTAEYKIDVVFFVNYQGDEVLTHYVYLKSMSRLMAGDVNHKLHYCYHCFSRFYSPEKIAIHKAYARCDERDTLTRDMLPTEENKWLKFKNESHTIKLPVAIYGDFECTTGKVYFNPNDNTKKIQKHEASGYNLTAVHNGHELMEMHYTGINAVEHLNATLEEWYPLLYPLVNPKKPMIYNSTSKANFEAATKCYLCDTEFSPSDDDSHSSSQQSCGDPNNKKVRDHDHCSGDYLGAAHNKCNLTRQVRKNTKIPIFFHNLKNYDGHLILKHLTNSNSRFGEPTCIAQNFEKFISFGYGGYQFKDSFLFMASSLDRLVKNLTRDDKTISLKYFRNRGFTESQIDLVLQKGVFPYDWFDSMEKLDATMLPPIESFYNHLIDEPCSQASYDHAHTVWDAFGCVTFKDYHDLYLKTDVKLLADVYENFRNTSFKSYGLDPAHYFTSPGLSWDAMLKKTGIELELLTDIDKFRFFENGLRGGVSMITTRYAKANNPYMVGYDETKKKSYILYWDANNLYGWAMSQKLPYRNFEWADANLDFMNYNAQGKKGCVLEVDMHLPSEFHQEQNDYPMASERLNVDPAWLSPFQNEILEQNDAKAGKCVKLVPNLMPKSKYIVHIRNLQYYVKKGWVVDKVHRVLEFDQKAWLAEYIDLNTQMRTMAKNDFESDFYKLMNNSVFGKTLENVRGRVDIKLVNNEKQMKKLSGNPLVKDHMILNEDLVIVQKHKQMCKLDKPIYVGMCILDLSKLLMYEFHYDFIVPKYGSDAKLLFTDTDSLCYHIKTDDIYDDIKKNSDYFDNSGYSVEHPCYDPINKKVIGKFKDEGADAVITEFVGNKPKSYTFRKETMVNGASEISDVKKLKGIKTYVVKNDIEFDDYKKCVLEKKSMDASMKTFRSFEHEIYTIDQTKMALNAFDDKRYIEDDGIHTLAYGHYLLLGLEAKN